MVKTDHFMYQEDLHYAADYLKKNWGLFGKKNILIIGATGLIGSFLADTVIYYNRNIQNQFEIYLMGRSLRRLERRFQYAMSEGMQNEIHLWEHDINLPIETEIKFDYIFHLASNADPKAYALYPVETITTNVQGTINMLKYAKEYPNVCILYTSSMEVYGENAGKKLEECDYGTLNYNQIRSGYPESKRVAELLYKSAVKQCGIHSCVARLGYVYGPTMSESDNKVVAEFIKAAVQGERLVLKSFGEQRRTYCYVADAVTGMLQIMASGTSGEAYNVADERSLVTIRQLGEIIARQGGVKLVLEHNMPESGVLVKNGDMVLNSGKLERLGWQAKIGIENGIERTITILKHDRLRK